MNTNMKLLAVLAGIVVILAIASFLIQQTTGSEYQKIVSSFNASNLSVMSEQQVSQPFIPADGRLVKVNGEDLQFYEFRSDADARQFALNVSPDATEIGNNNILWVGEPHLFMSKNVIAIYVGTNQQILNALSSSMGTQFAGSGTVSYCPSSSREPGACIELYSPVCGWFKPSVQCIKYPCAQTFSNSCFACKDDKVLYYTQGECPQ